MTLSVVLKHDFGEFGLDVAFVAPPGVTALFGRSGAGKTTVVNAVAGLLRPREGRIAAGDWVLVDTDKGIFLPTHKRRLGYVFQEGRLFPHLTVRQNLTYGRRFARAPRDTVQEARVIEMLGIGPLLTRRPGALSGGEKQRVAIGRALLSAPRLLLMDEPLAALDAARKEEILPYLERLRDETACPILYVSHSVAEVARLATTVVALDQGRVLRAGPTGAVLSDPGAVPALGNREAGSVLTARVVTHHADGLSELATSNGRLFLPNVQAAPGSRLRVRIHAQDVMLALDRPRGVSALNILEGEIAALQPGEGPGMIVQLRAGDDLILSRITRRSGAALGLAVGLRCHAVIKTVSVAQGDVGADG